VVRFLSYKEIFTRLTPAQKAEEILRHTESASNHLTNARKVLDSYEAIVADVNAKDTFSSSKSCSRLAACTPKSPVKKAG
jgi:hypothetical protein